MKDGPENLAERILSRHRRNKPESATPESVVTPCPWLHLGEQKQPQDLTTWAESLITKHGRVSLIMDNYAVLGLRDAETLAFQRETFEMMGEYGEVRVKGVTVETWGEKPQNESDAA